MEQQTSYGNNGNEQTVAETGLYFGLFTSVSVVYSLVGSGLRFSLK